MAQSETPKIKAGQSVRLPDGRCAVVAFHNGKTARVLVEGRREAVAVSALRPVGTGPTLSAAYRAAHVNGE